jgi:hypothetical protein
MGVLRGSLMSSLLSRPSYDLGRLDASLREASGDTADLLD